MGDKPMKTIPPKLSEIGKEIKVRVFEVNPNKFTNLYYFFII